ncbi:hypothetical protein A8990_12735 [Paenibacillus taihuensis]|uniref:YCII-related domain-containing protein n=1 Tax=Paenibacillus taihuensis TaxID=1156355 RepID=A0A3D9RHN8_9BACL|nr:YciI family protein [Paenibacillus taihuensis]REE77715.1 hypothetical protein A8990_12735 [Paenibacillus taihuensis]
MQFFVHLSNKQRHLMTEGLVRDHVEYLRKLKEKDVLPFCGPCKDGTAIMILSCGNLEEASLYVEEDPFSKAGYYETRSIVEVEEANAANNFHLDKVVDYLTTRTV